MMNLAVCLLLELAVIIQGEIKRDKNAPLCLGVECKNGGTIDDKTCTCLCTEMMTGLFCEKELLTSKWPNGPYGLPSTQYGCPETELHGWKTGYMNFTISSELSPQDWSKHDNFIQPNDLLGPYDKDHLQMNFCIKNVDNGQDIAWPNGSYCIYQVGEKCPNGFTSGSITMTGYRLSKLDINGWLPRYDFKEENETDALLLDIFYCCKNDTQLIDEKLRFGEGWPFIFIKSGLECPTLSGMLLINEYFNYTSGKIPWSHSGTTPECTTTHYNTVVLNYCYYTPPENDTWRGENENNSTEHVHLLSKNKPVIASSSDSAKDAYDGKTGPACIHPFFSTDAHPAWIQIDMQYLQKVIRVELTGSVSAVLISRYQWDFLHNGAMVCRAPDISTRDQHKWDEHLFQSLACRRSVEVQYVTIYRRIDINSRFTPSERLRQTQYDEIDIIVEDGVCGKPLGFVSGAIHDYQVYFSIEPKVWRVDGRTCLRFTNESAPHIVIDLIVPTVVQGLLIIALENTVSISIQYGVSADNLTMYTDPSGKQIFGINENVQTLIMLSSEILATLIRITFVAYNADPAYGICVKLELIGCPRQVFRDTRCGSSSVYLGLATAWNVIANLPYFKWSQETEPLYSISTEECETACLNRTDCLSSTWTTVNCIMFPMQLFTISEKLYLEIDEAVYSEKLCIGHVQADDTCQYDVSAPGVVTSPMYPFHYGANKECVWHIKFPVNKTIRLEILELLLPAVEMERNRWECVDQLSIKNVLGTNGTHRQYETLRIIEDTHLYTYPNSVLYSSTNELYVELTSCYHYKTRTNGRFAINVSEADHAGCGFFNPTVNSTCTAQYGKLASPFYPAFYDLIGALSWTIIASHDQYVQLLFFDIDIPSDSKCFSSYVSVHDVRTETSSSQLIGRYCSENQEHGYIRSSWNAMRITMASDGFIRGTGFIATYELKSGIFKLKSHKTETNKCSDGWVAWNGNCYKYVKSNSSQNWETAEKLCNTESGHLLSIEDEEEMEYIHNLLTAEWGNLSPVIIGLYKDNDYSSINDYKWTNGKVATYFDWAYNSARKQPDGGGNERCTLIQPSSVWRTQSWFDYDCAFGEYTSFICKITTETTAIRNTPNHVDISKHRRSWWFVCNDGSVISFVYVCDGLKDCHDASDEVKCGDRQHTNMFRCSTGEYIHIGRLCDHTPDCLNSEDETRCVHKQCGEGQWRCANDQCIAKHKKCNFKVDCVDKSDENDCGTCQNGGFQCFGQKCIPPNRQDDGIVDCSAEHHEDEKELIIHPVQTTCEAWYRLGARQNGQYLVNYGGEESFFVECIFPNGGANQIFIHANHNLQGKRYMTTYYETVKIKYLPTLQQIRRLTNVRTCEQFITTECSLTTDAFEAVLYWEDLTNIYTRNDFSIRYPDNRTIRCKDGYKDFSTKPPYYKMTIKLYTSLHDIPLWSMESSGIGRVEISPVICEEEIQNTTQNQLLCKNGFITDMRNRCILKLDDIGEIEGCRDMSHLEECHNFECPKTYVKCPDSFCIPMYLYCDGIKHCPKGADEIGCVLDVERAHRNRPDEGNIDCSGLFSCHNSSVCIPLDEVCDDRKHCKHGDDESLCDVNCPDTCSCDGMAFTCSGFPDLTEVSNRVRKLSIGKMEVSPQKLLLSQFSYLAKLIITQSNLKMLKNITFKGLDNLMDLDLSNNLIETLDDQTFKGLENLLFLNISKNKISKILTGSFHSLESLISLDIRENDIETMDSGLFDGLSSLEYLYTDEYRFCCIRPNSVAPENCHPSEDEFSSCEDLLRNQLMRISLWTIGSVALVGNGISIVYRLCFDRESLNKSHGIFVLNLCFSDFLMGIYLFIIASADEYYRGRYIYNEAFWRYSAGCQVAGVLATLSSEASTTILCFITLDRFLAIKYPFSTAKFNALRAKVSALFNWLFAVFISILPIVGIPYFQDEFYSRSGTCLALPLTRDRRGGWLYSVIVFIGYNFIAFTAIVIGQSLIYMAIQATTAATTIRKSGVQDRNIVIARNLFLVVFTDFLCWFPTAIMGVAAIFGYPVPGEMYAWTTVFILPINSALNPVLYTLKAYRQRKKASRIRSQFTDLTAEIERLKGVLASNKQKEQKQAS